MLVPYTVPHRKKNKKYHMEWCEIIEDIIGGWCVREQDGEPSFKALHRFISASWNDFKFTEKQTPVQNLRGTKIQRSLLFF